MAKKIENVIYILTNPQYPGYVKIGYASDLKQRISSLNTGVLVSFSPYAVYETSLQNADVEIHAIIRLLNPILRASKFEKGKVQGKEFFKLEPEEAFELFKHIAKVSGTESKAYRVTADYKPILPDPPKDVTDEVVEDEGGKEPPGRQDQMIPDGLYKMSRKMKIWDGREITAKAVVAGKEWRVQPGSIICPVDGKGLSSGLIDKRRNAKVVNNILQEEVVFTSPSGACCFVSGCSTDGFDYWQTENGVSLHEVRDEWRKKNEA